MYANRTVLLRILTVKKDELMHKKYIDEMSPPPFFFLLYFHDHI